MVLIGGQKCALFHHNTFVNYIPSFIICMHVLLKKKESETYAGFEMSEISVEIRNKSPSNFGSVPHFINHFGVSRDLHWALYFMSRKRCTFLSIR